MIRATAICCVLLVLGLARLMEGRNLQNEQSTTANNFKIDLVELTTGNLQTVVPVASEEIKAQHKLSLQRPPGTPCNKSSAFWDPPLTSVLMELFFGEEDEHKPLWPLNWRDISTFIVAILALFIAAGGGIGGGGVLVPLFILALGFTTSVAVALSNIAIVGGALVNFSFNVKKRHAYFKRPLIDWDLILVMEPATILGALIGGYFNKVSPAYLTTTLLALLLTFLTKNLVSRSINTWNKETREREAALGTAAEGDGVQTPLLNNTTNGTVSNGVDSRPEVARRSLSRIGSKSHVHAPLPPPLASSDDAEVPHAEGAHRNVEKTESISSRFAEHRQVPPGKFGVLVLLFIAVVVGDTAKKYTTCGTWAYWLVVLSIIPIVLLVTYIVRIYLVRDYYAKEQAGYTWLEGDVEWSEYNTIVYPLICSLAGLVAGAFGVGGGIVKGPLMLEMGVLPDVAAATSATMICFTAASACVIYLSFGGIPYDYAGAVFAIGVLATLAGQVSTHWLVSHLNRRSIIIIAMAVLMALSMVMSYYEAGVLWLAAIRDHALDQFHSIC
eukprot:jgi/Botrbrau1/6767/Bobra.0057s0003.1